MNIKNADFLFFNLFLFFYADFLKQIIFISDFKSLQQ